MAQSLTKTQSKYGSDLIIDILCQHGIEYVSCNPGATFRGLHDSVVNYQNDLQLILCCHEEIAVAIAHGYAKASGKFMAVFLHSNVGLQHASMAIFNAWCDRVPILVICGVGPLDASKRRPWIDWIHTSNNQGNIVHDYVKWEDQPYNLASVPESLYRACRIINTEPKAPAYIGIDALIQESEIPENFFLEDVTKYSPPALPQANLKSLHRAAKLLVNAKFPIVVVDYMGRNSKAVKMLIKLAELLKISVIDCGRRYNFPNNHPLCLTGVDKDFFKNVDVVLVLDVNDLANVFGEFDKKEKKYKSYLNSSAKIINITMADYLISKWSADYYKLFPIDISIAADSSVVLPELVKLCKSSAKNEKRFKTVKSLHNNLRKSWKSFAISEKNKTPLSVPAVIHEMWQVIKNEDWVLTNNASVSIGNWIKKLWVLDKEGCHIGESGGAGLGYGIGASIGAALAYKNSGKICINMQTDGDLLFTPSALWTIAHYKLPLLIIVMNNQTYGNTKKHALEIANNRNRNKRNAHFGNDLNKPTVNFPELARSFGLCSLSTIKEVKKIKPTIEQAIKIIKEKKQAVLVDILIA